VLLDPRLLALPQGDGRDDWLGFWTRVTDWAADRRVKVGTSTHVLACQRFAERGWPDNLEVIPAELRAPARAALNGLLARVLPLDEVLPGACFRPSYSGDSAETQALGVDVRGIGSHGRCVTLATSFDSWSEACAEVQCAPPPPEKAHLCFVPGEQLIAEREATIKTRASGVRIRIVGGQREARIAADVEDAFSPLSCEWLPCERHKPPRLDGWEASCSEHHIVVCVTGYVGHSTSDRARAMANSAGAVYLMVSTASGICAAISNHLAGPQE
jgi:hypothetical protein